MRKYALLLALAASSVSMAQVTYSTNFDTMSIGNLAGQDGWITGSGTSNVPAVTNNAWLSSPNSVMLTRPASGGSSFNSVSRAFAPGAANAANRMLIASADIFVQSIAGTDRYFGIGFGTSALATGGYMGIALGGNGLRGGGGSYASYNDLAGGLLQSRALGDFSGRWVRVSVAADRMLTTNNVVFTFSGLGTSGGNATETFTKSVNFGTTNISHIQLFSDWGSSSTVAGTAFVDNVSFQAVPEPATMAVMGLGVAALLRRRKRA
ncbi:MAG TPA: PEP-CTERM sorting domain-containing protein [Fimbriimonadaceae bacterium]|nr:PEP-CTERM sorting domain-containing protein [Fimbriimonadaceae bacterium]